MKRKKELPPDSEDLDISGYKWKALITVALGVAMAPWMPASSISPFRF